MIRIFLFFFIFLITKGLQAQDFGLYWKYKDYDGAIGISVPRWATFIGSAFLDEKADRKMLRKVRKARVLFFEDGSPFKERDLKRFARKAKRRNLDELLTVRSGKTRVMVHVKSRGSTVRKLVVLFNSPEGAGLITVKGRFKLNELNKVIEKTQKDGDKNHLPNLPNIPVIRA